MTNNTSFDPDSARRIYTLKDGDCGWWDDLGLAVVRSGPNYIVAYTDPGTNFAQKVYSKPPVDGAPQIYTGRSRAGIIDVGAKMSRKSLIRLIRYRSWPTDCPGL